MSDRWGVPDWREAENYGSTEAWDLDRWRWEFTRRKKEYRRDYIAALASLPDPRAAISSGGSQPGAIAHCGAEKYGLPAFYDPRVSEWSHDPRPRWMTGLWPLLELLEPDRLVFLGSQPHRSMFSFDLEKPLKPQLEEAERGLAALQKASQKSGAKKPAETKPAKWLRNLRVVDARDTGATWGEIVATVSMCPATQTVGSARDAEKAGRRGIGI